MEFLVPSKAEMADTFSVMVAVGGFARTFLCSCLMPLRCERSAKWQFIAYMSSEVGARNCSLKWFLFGFKKHTLTDCNDIPLGVRHYVKYILFKAQWYRQFNIQQFCIQPTQTVFVCCISISEQTAIISLYSIN